LLFLLSKENWLKKHHNLLIKTTVNIGLSSYSIYLLHEPLIAMTRNKIVGDGYYTGACETLLCEKYGFAKAYLTTSCTDALELTALLINIQERG
jgi:peptidoglycan/LPS O-acetylase OafA/YrhL